MCVHTLTSKENRERPESGIFLKFRKNTIFNKHPVYADKIEYLFQGNPGGLNPKYPTLPEHLAREGYETYLVGKWHLGASKEEHHPNNRGFNHFYGLLGGGFNHYTKQCGSGRYDFWRDRVPEFDNTTHSTHMLNAEALRVVKRHVEGEKKKEPFFLFLSHPAPHDPLQAPEKYQEMCSHISSYRRRIIEKN